MTMRFIRHFKLAGSNEDDMHPYLSKDGAFHGANVALLEKDELDRWRQRPAPVLEKILSAGYGVPVDMSRRMQSLDVVARSLNDNNPCRAAIALVQAQFLPLVDNGAAKRMVDADELAKWGSLAYLTQPRVAAGMVGAGQWTTGAGEAAASSFAARSLPWLLQMSARLTGPLAVAAGILFPNNETLTSNGGVPDHPGLNYRFSEMRLTLIQNDEQGGARLLFSGMPGQDGFYRDSDGTIVGRAVGNSFLLDNSGVATMNASQTESRASAGTATDDASEQPKLCPDPSPDRPSGMSDRAAAYQEQITGLPRGMAVYLNGVMFDGCRTTDGTMLEAKGPGYEFAMTPDGGWKDWYEGIDDLKADLPRYSAAAGARMVEYHFAEPKVAAYVSDYVQSAGLSNISVFIRQRGPHEF